MTDKNLHDEKPPLFPSWGYWYVVVVAWLLVLITVFYLFTKTFS